MKNRIIASHILLFIFISACISDTCYSQTWSAPVRLTGLGYSYNPDVIMDKNGALHCVWVQTLGEYYTRIIYSKSLDNGSTWTKPVQITSNIDKWLEDPHIISDTNGNLYVSYDYDIIMSGAKICYVKFDAASNAWGPQIEIGSGLSNRMVVDFNNRIYFFWLDWNSYFRFLENGMLSDSMLVLDDPGTNCYIKDITVDRSNNLHCIGGRSEGDSVRVSYFLYKDGEWLPFVDVGYKNSREARIRLASDEVPKFAWRQRVPDIYSYNEGTFFTEIIAGSVSSPVLVKDSTDFISLAVDRKDCIHIVESERNGQSYQLVHRFKANGSWQSKIIDENAYYLSSTELKTSNSCLHLVYCLTDSVSGSGYLNVYSNIIYRRLDIPPGIDDLENLPGIIAYPNPFTESVAFELPGGYAELREFTVFNIYGVPVYHATPDNLEGKNRKITWNGLSDSGTMVREGLYTVKLLLETGCISTKIIKLSR